MEKEYYIVEGDTRVGPLTLAQLAAKGIEPATLVWTAGLADWTRADCIQELAPLLAAQTRVEEPKEQNAYKQPPYQQQYGQQYGQGQPYGRRNDAYANRNVNNGGNPYQGGVNWKTLSIVATVAGFLFSCIGGLIGIFAILAANKAENAMNYGDEYTARNCWSNCKTLTIISFILVGIGLIANIAFISNFAKYGLSAL